MTYVMDFRFYLVYIYLIIGNLNSMENQTNKSMPENLMHTNIPIIDEGHDKLAEIQKNINILKEKGACKNDLADIFFALSYFFENHLIKEELYLMSKDYPNFDNHKTSHFDFIKGIERLMDNYESNVDNTLKELDIFIGEWLQSHSSNYNKDVVDYLNQKK